MTELLPGGGYCTQLSKDVLSVFKAALEVGIYYFHLTDEETDLERLSDLPKDT